MEKVRPWCGQPSDRGRLRNRTELIFEVMILALRSRATPSSLSFSSSSSSSSFYFAQDVALSIRCTHLAGQPAVVSMFVGFIGPAVCLIITGWIECDAAGAVAMIVIAVGLSGISMAGWAVNHLDLAPPFAGILFTLRYYRLKEPILHLLWWIMERFFGYNFPKPEAMWMKSGI